MGDASTIARVAAAIPELDAAAAGRAAARQERLTKPPGSLGRLEALANGIAGMTGEERPRLERRLIVVAAGDHGVAAQGVSAYPPEVTAQMVANFIAGGAAISVLAGHAGARVRVVDAGVVGETPTGGGLLRLAPRTRHRRHHAGPRDVTRDGRARDRGGDRAAGGGARRRRRRRRRLRRDGHRQLHGRGRHRRGRDRTPGAVGDGSWHRRRRRALRAQGRSGGASARREPRRRVGWRGAAGRARRLRDRRARGRLPRRRGGARPDARRRPDLRRRRARGGDGGRRPRRAT